MLIRYRIQSIGQENVPEEHLLFMRSANKKNAAEHMQLSPIRKENLS